MTNIDNENQFQQTDKSIFILIFHDILQIEGRIDEHTDNDIHIIQTTDRTTPIILQLVF